MSTGDGRASSGWREPTSTIPLRFGSYRPRYLLSLALLFGGGILLQFTSVYTLPLLTVGVLASVAGWVVVPSAGWRRSTAVVPGFLGAAGSLNGAQSGALVALTLGCWLLVRMRPRRCYPVVVIPIIAAYSIGIAFPQYEGRVIVSVTLVVSVAASAWLARSLAASKLRRIPDIFQRGHRNSPLK